MAKAEEIIAAVSPYMYQSQGMDIKSEKEFKEFVELIKEEGVSGAISETKPHANLYSGDYNEGLSQEQDGFALESSKAKGVEDSHTLTYETYAESLEPVYYYIHDMFKSMGWKIEKIVDNFQSAPGSQHFSEMGQKKTVMQQQGSKLMGDINIVLRSILNLVYDLKEFRIRLQSYVDLESGDKETKRSAYLSLKQVWLDKVDMNKGNSSLKAMALGQAGFVTLLDAFLASESVQDVEKLDLNDRVKRILKPRVQEFEVWIKESGRELQKRYEVERTYLKSQVASLKLYTRWAKPYLEYAKTLEQKSGVESESDIVNSFNRTLLEVTLFGTLKLDIHGTARSGGLPKFFENDKFVNRMKKAKKMRDYYSCVLLRFKFRSVPQQGGIFVGRVDVDFKSYALAENELKEFRKQLNDDDLNSGLDLIKDITDDSLGNIKEDIDEFMKEDDELRNKNKKSKKKKEKAAGGDVNPFLAMIGYYNKSDKKEDKKEESKEEEEYKLKKDDEYLEAPLRAAAAATAIGTNFSLYDVYKKAHKMASFS